MEIKEFGQNLWIFCVINTDIHTLERKKKKKLRRKQKDLLLNIIIIMLTFVRRNFFRRKEILQKPRSNQKWKNKSEAYLKEIPRLFIHYCGKMKVLLWKKTSSNSYLMLKHLPFYIVHYIIASKKIQISWLLLTKTTN